MALGGDRINYINCFYKITGIKLPDNVSVIQCADDKEYLAAVDKWGTQCKVPFSTIRASLEARGVYIYSALKPDEPSAVIVNDARIFREKGDEASVDYATDMIVFHELGHCATKNKLKGVFVDTKRELFPALVMKESFACYYSYLCLAELYGTYSEDDDIRKEVIGDLNFFAGCAKESISSYSQEDGYSFLLSPTDIGNIIGEMLTCCKPVIDSLDKNSKDDIFSSCSDPKFVRNLYDFACKHLELLSNDVITFECISEYCNEFDKIFRADE